ncbi:MAG: MaoC family dehydratase N-terminal domain-containing protein [Dehalococcoidia bacterium]|nr:MaoC family dehydratase N-terminal domain-containing protein [Dehalococcoidia bacterium]
MADVKVGDKRDQVVIERVTRTHIVKYAGTSGDYNPLHHDDEFAQKAGYPSVFAHGMLSMGLTGRMLTDWFGAVALRKYGVRFTKQVFPGEQLTAHGEVTAIAEENGEKRAVVHVWTTNSAGETVVDGEAVAAV